MLATPARLKTTNFLKTGGAESQPAPKPTMSTTTETTSAPEGAKPAEARGLVLYAVIKRSSKYAYQGQDERGKPVAMRVTELEDRTEYAFHLENGNRYRREDLTFSVGEGTSGRLVKLR